MMTYIESTAPDTLVTTYLEMTHISQFQPDFIQASDVVIEEMKHVDVDFYRFLYRAVGEKWRWRDRLVMPTHELESAISGDNVRIFVLYVSGVPAGYIELVDRRGDVEVAYFGLREPFIGRGLGKHLLSYGVERAWQMNAHRVWLHTCNLDGPHALHNYQKRGFYPYMSHEEDMPVIYTN